MRVLAIVVLAFVVGAGGSYFVVHQKDQHALNMMQSDLDISKSNTQLLQAQLDQTKSDLTSAKKAAFEAAGSMPISGNSDKATSGAIKYTHDEMRAIEEVKASLKDPSSAIWGPMRKVTSSDGKDYICGFVNSKNSFGGFSGMHGFAVDLTPGVISVAFENDSDGLSGLLWTGVCSNPQDSSDGE